MKVLLSVRHRCSSGNRVALFSEGVLGGNMVVATDRSLWAMRARLQRRPARDVAAPMVQRSLCDHWRRRMQRLRVRRCIAKARDSLLEAPTPGSGNARREPCCTSKSRDAETRLTACSGKHRMMANDGLTRLELVFDVLRLNHRGDVSFRKWVIMRASPQS